MGKRKRTRSKTRKKNRRRTSKTYPVDKFFEDRRVPSQVLSQEEVNEIAESVPPTITEEGKSIDTIDFIFQVKATVGPDNTGYRYYGRRMNSEEDELLETTWMNENKMRSQWRRNNLVGRNKRFIDSWVKVPVGKVKTPSHFKSVVDKISKNACIPGGIYKFCQHMGLHTHADMMIKLMKTSVKYGRCVQQFLSCGGFNRVRTETKTKDLVCDTDPKLMYLVQVTSKYGESTDNSHSIVVYNKLIFDINHKLPLPLNKRNLDLICVGDDWKFDHISRIFVFEMTL